MSGPGLELPPTDPRALILRHLRPPAFLLLCVGILNAFFCVVMTGALALGVHMPWSDPATGGRAASATPTLPLLAILAFSAIWSALTIQGALNAMRLRGYGLAVVGAIGAMVPPAITCTVGLPIGIWMLVVLNRPGVKTAFISK
jgi:hypothetical protein